MTTSPFFITGPPRSGTTLFAACIDRHPEVFIPPETSFAMPQMRLAVAQDLKLRRVRHPLSSMLLTNLGLDESSVLSPKTLNCHHSYSTLLVRLFEEARKVSGHSVIGEKSPANLPYVPFILRTWPSAKIFIMVRDGRDVVLSCQKVPVFDNRLWHHAISWNKWSHRTYQWKKRYPNNVRLIRFEDFVAKPAQTLAFVMDELALTFQPTQLDPDRRTSVKLDWETWKENIGSSVDPKRAHAWRREDELPSGFSQACRLMGNELKRWSYEDSHEGLGRFIAPLEIAALQGLRVMEGLPSQIKWRILRKA